ncbi:hypothetical protein AB4396_21440, partial [Vibrio cyclitrophicus]
TAHYHGFDAWSTLSSRIAASKTTDPDERKLSGFFFIHTSIYYFPINLSALNLTKHHIRLITILTFKSFTS